MEVRKEDQRDQYEKVVEIEIERLRDFKNHPFNVQADSQILLNLKCKKIKIITITVIDKIESIMYNTDIHKKATKY